MSLHEMGYKSSVEQHYIDEDIKSRLNQSNKEQIQKVILHVVIYVRGSKDMILI